MIEGRNILVCGRTRSGKSYLTKRLIAEAPRLLVYAPKREEHDYPGVYFDGLIEGDFERLARWWQYADRRCHRVRLVYRPANLFDLREFERVCKLVYAYGDMVFVAEEVMGYLPAINLNAFGDDRKPEAFIRILTAGAVRGIWLYLCSQRPVCIPHLMTSQVQEAYLFVMHEAGDIKYIRDTFGYAAAVAMGSLGEYQYTHWLGTGSVTVDRVKD